MVRRAPPSRTSPVFIGVTSFLLGFFHCSTPAGKSNGRDRENRRYFSAGAHRLQLDRERKFCYNFAVDKPPGGNRL